MGLLFTAMAAGYVFKTFTSLGPQVYAGTPLI